MGQPRTGFTPIFLGLFAALATDGVRGESPIRCIEPDPATGSSRAVVVGAAPLLHSAQVVPVDGAGKLVGKDDGPRQIAQVMDQLDRLLPNGRSGWDRVVKLNVTVDSPATRAAVERVLVERFPGKVKPAVSFVQGALPVEGARVAVDAVAVSDADGQERRVRRLPGSGPSAAVLPVGPCVYVAGQAEKGELAEATRKTLASLRQTLAFLGVEESQVVQVRAFVRPISDLGPIHKELAAHFGKDAVPPVVFVEWISTLPIEIELIAAAPGKSREPVEYLTPPGMQASPVYSRVARVGEGPRIYVSGLTSSIASDGATQVQDVFRTLGRVLEAAGSDFRHLAKATYYVMDEDASRQLNDVRPKYYDPKRPPAASKAMVPGVGRTGRRVSLDMIAVPAPGAKHAPDSRTPGDQLHLDPLPAP
jgi:enamine deaminase RidA (YjgF/YER057c/UK114 family)